MPHQTRFGQLPPRYRFALNRHADYRAAGCPRCNGLTYPRKFALLIHVEPEESRAGQDVQILLEMRVHHCLPG